MKQAAEFATGGLSADYETKKGEPVYLGSVSVESTCRMFKGHTWGIKAL
jgi:hypothetical protein